MKPKFNPNQAFQVADQAKPKFNPNKPFESEQPNSEEPKSKPLGVVVRNSVQGLASSFSDEAAGVVEAGGQAIGLKGLGGPMKDISISENGPTLSPSDLKRAYIAGRNAERQALEQDMKDYPELALASQIAGGVLSPATKLIAPGASIVKSGAVLGGINGLGLSEANNVVDMGKDAVLGAATGAVLGKGIEKGSQVLKSGASRAGEKFKNAADWMAARAVGAERATAKKIGADNVKKIGRYALDEGLLTPLSNVDDVIARNEGNLSRGASKMNEAYQKIDDAGASTFNPLDVAAKVDSKVGGFYRSPINKAETSQLENTLESILMRGDKNIPLKTAQELKEELGKVANWKNNLNITDKERMAREAYKLVSQSIDDAAEAGSKAISKDGVLEGLRSGKQLYSAAKGAKELLTNKQAAQNNKLVSLTDWGVLGAGGAGIPITGGASVLPTLAIYGTKKAAEKYGAQSTALALNSVYKTLTKTPEVLKIYQKNPQAFQGVMTQIEKGLGLFDSGASGIPARIADGEQVAKLKGEKKWTVDGFVNLAKHDKSIATDEKLIEQMMATSKGKQLLIAASDLRPGSKSMNNLMNKIKTQYKKDGQ